MELINNLGNLSRKEFRLWLEQNSTTQKECWVIAFRGEPKEDRLSYIDAVEEAICFGWIDSTLKNIDGIPYQRFSKRVSSNWTEVNKARAERLISLGLMKSEGLAAYKEANAYIEDEDIINELKKSSVYDIFMEFPELYRRVKISNISKYKNDKEVYSKKLKVLIEKTKQGKTYGEWNDYGRLK